MEEEIRKGAIMDYVKGQPPKEIYTRLNRSKKWFFKWLKRYQTGNVEWYKEYSRAPKSQARETPREQKELILGTRKRLEDQPFSQVGTSSIKWELHKLGLSFPSDRTINRILTREGLTKKNCLHPERCRVSLLHGTGGYQQPASDGSRRSPVY
jgi:transposase